MKVSSIILASGSGERFKGDLPKQFQKLAGLPIIAHTLKVFQACSFIDQIIVVTSDNYVGSVWKLINQQQLTKVEKVVIGGQTRQESSRIGLESCDILTEYVFIHDAVRPFLSQKVLTDLVSAVKLHKAVDTVIPSADTLVEIDQKGFIRNIPDRSAFRRGQTPQAFSRELLLQAHRQALVDGIDNATDDCQLVMRLGHRVYCVEGCEQNIKITYPIDIHIADKLFQLNALQLGDIKTDTPIPDFLLDKVFVVIGGSSGIGGAVVNLLKDNVSDRVYSLCRTAPPRIDVTKPPSIETAFSSILEAENNIDFVVNCAGDLIRKPIANMTLNEWEQIYETNVTGCFNLAKALSPIFKRQHSGSLMFVGSSSYTRGRGGYAAYSSSKAALVNFCQALSEELADWNIRVNVASPGRVNTPLRYRNFGKEDPETLLDPDLVARKIIAALAMDTTGSVIEIA